MTRKTWFRRRRTAGRLWAVSVTRLLAFQAILVGLLLLLRWPGIPVAVAAGLAGAAAVAVTFGRWRGRWWTEVAALWLRYRRQGAGAAEPAPDDDPRLVALRKLVPDLVVEDVPGAGTDTYGMGSDGAGWFAVLEVETNASVHPPVPLAALARITAEAGQPGVVTQVVSHAAGPHRTVWVAVRLDAETVAESAVDSPGGPPDIPAVLAEISRRLGRALRRRGLTARLLDTEGLLDALVRSCDLDPAGEDEQAPGSRETWQAWQSTRYAHRCFWLRKWPDAEHASDLLASLHDLPDAEVSIALLLEPGRDSEEADLRCLLRLAATPDGYQRTGERAGHLAGRLGGSLFPLDGEHALAVYATAPSGGGAR